MRINSCSRVRKQIHTLQLSQFCSVALLVKSVYSVVLYIFQPLGEVGDASSKQKEHQVQIPADDDGIIDVENFISVEQYLLIQQQLMQHTQLLLQTYLLSLGNPYVDAVTRERSKTCLVNIIHFVDYTIIGDSFIQKYLILHQFVGAP